jgi:branched-chain amino acid transport system substrate-binding protein
MLRGKKWVIPVALAVVVLSACAPPAPETVVETEVVEVTREVEVTKEVEVEVPVEPEVKELIKIGLAAPFSGAVAYMGEDANMGVTLAIDEINAEGGVMGHLLQLSVADNACAPDQAVSAIRKLVEVDQVDVIQGSYCSSCSLAAMPIIEQYEVPMVTGASSNASITEMAGVGGNIWEFRVNAHDGMMSQSLSKMMSEEIGSTTILAANNDWGRGAAAAFEENLKTLGVEVLSTDFFEQGQADYHSLLTKWKGLNSDAILLIMESHDAAIFMRQFREMGMPQKVYARGSVVTAEFVEDIQDDLSIGDGIVEATIWTVGTDSEFDERFKDRWGVLPHVHSAGGYVVVRYVIPEAVRIAIEETGKADRASIRDALEKVDIAETLYGPVKFDDHHQAHTYLVITALDDQGNISVLKRVPTE